MRNRFMEDESQTADQSQNYVYLPFVKKECSEILLEKIHTFIRNNSIGNEDTSQRYQFLTYGRESLLALPAHSKIYITAFGINLSSIGADHPIMKDLAVEEHIYSISGGNKAITMQTVVDRMVKDGLLTSNKLTIKLWFGDCNDKALLMAEKFRSCLTNRYTKNSFNIHYYPHCILYPPSTHGGEKHKWAIDIETRERKRASQVRQCLFFNPEKERNTDQPDQGGLSSFFENLNIFSKK